MFGYVLKIKSLPAVMGALQKFESWVKRQYGLSICKFRHDNDKSVIAIIGETAY